MSSVITPRECSASYSDCPKSSPTGPTTRVSAKNDEASAKCTAEPPSSRSRFPVSVSTASNAMDPTTVSDLEGRDGSVPAMRAVVITEFDGPEALQLVEDHPQPEPAEGQVLVKVSRAGINFADTHARENSYLSSYKLPLIPGGEVAGEVDGRRVVAPEAAVFPLPDGVSDTAALAIIVQGLSAWHLLKTSSHLAEGESVVVHAAAGGVGSLAVQLAKRYGAGRVIATASSEQKRALALELGADVAVDPNEEDLKGALREANGGAKVDIVLEMAGGRVLDQSLRALAPFGRLVTYGQ